MEHVYTQLRQLVTMIHPIGDDDFAALSDIWEPFKARRKVALTTIGEREHYLYFVADGVQRIYHTDDQGREATIVFTYAPSFGGVMDALLLQQPSRYHYETLTPSTFIRAPFRDVAALMETRPDIERVIRLGVTQALSGVLERLVELQCFSAEERFRALLRRSPHMLQLVPHKYLANYLGIDATNFSKLINTIRI